MAFKQECKNTTECVKCLKGTSGKMVAKGLTYGTEVEPLLEKCEKTSGDDRTKMIEIIIRRSFDDDAKKLVKYTFTDSLGRIGAWNSCEASQRFKEAIVPAGITEYADNVATAHAGGTLFDIVEDMKKMEEKRAKGNIGNFFNQHFRVYACGNDFYESHT